MMLCLRASWVFTMTLVACSTGSASTIGDANPRAVDADPRAPDADPTAPDAAQQPADARIVVPVVGWGETGTGCPRASIVGGAGQTTSAIKLSTHWNSDVSTYLGEVLATSAAHSSSPFIINGIGNGDITPTAGDDPAALYLELAPERTVAIVNRMFDDEYVQARRGCIEGARMIGSFASTSMVVYADDLGADSQADAPALTIIVGANRRVILTYPATATLINPDDVVVTVFNENIDGLRRIALGTGNQDVNVATYGIAITDTVTLVADRR